jgi:hypothetical protein
MALFHAVCPLRRCLEHPAAALLVFTHFRAVMHRADNDGGGEFKIARLA